MEVTPRPRFKDREGTERERAGREEKGKGEELKNNGITAHP